MGIMKDNEHLRPAGVTDESWERFLYYIDSSSKDHLMTFAEVYKHLRVSRSTAGRMRRAGDFPPWVIIGRRKRWRFGDVDEWLHSRRGVAAP